MSEHEEENPLFEDLGLGAEDLTFAEAGSEATPAAESPAEAEGGEDLAAIAEPAEGDASAPEGEEPIVAEEEPSETPEEEIKPKKKAASLAFHAQWIVAVLACVAVALGFTFANVPHVIWHASGLITMIVLVSATWISRKVWATFQITALYTVLLAGALAALLIGVYCLGLELYVYGWDLKAKQAGKAAASATFIPAPAPAPAPTSAPRPAEKRN
jgi:hypothetical protein